MDIHSYFNHFYAGTKNPSLKAMQYFMEEFGHPEKNLKFIHIAGTNGKGSITEMLSNILIKAGYRTGKFMSPHLMEENERICINHQRISEKEMEKLALECMPKVEKYNQMQENKVTLFELQTTMALLYFSRNHCDFVILETGLGGLYDCTNVIESSLAILSSIGYDHMDILGKTLPEIARQKAGIIKENEETIFVRQEPEVNEVIQKVCQEKKNILHTIEERDITDIVYGEKFTQFSYQKDKNIQIPLKGEKQPQNAAICLECVKILRKRGYVITDSAVRDGLQTVVHKGRFETICQKPKIIFDGAHNEPAIQHFKNTIHIHYKNAKKVFIISILQRKDYRKVLEQLLQEEGVFIVTSGNEEGDFVTKEELYDLAQKINPKQELHKLELREALQLAHEEYSDYVTFVIGSFYVYKTVIQEIEEEKNDTN